MLIRYVVLGLVLALGAIVLVAGFLSAYRMRDELLENPWRFLRRVVMSPLLFLVLAGVFWLAGERFYPLPALCLVLASLVLAFWDEL